MMKRNFALTTAGRLLMSSMYQEIGGEAALIAVVDDFYLHQRGENYGFCATSAGS
jgi:hypothetical protein